DLLPDLRLHYQQSVARIDRVPAASLSSSRGCPYRCIFCARNVFGVSHRAHSAPYVLRMVDYLIEHYGVRSLAFEDENFVVQRDRLTAICETFIARKLDITWSCAARVDLVRADDLALMRRAGCTSISYGIESGCQRILDNLGKGLKLAGIERGIALTNAAGIRPRGYFIIGSPGEDLASIQETIDFVRRVPFAEVQMSHMCPFPGTELYATAAQHGTFANDWSKLNIWTPVFVPRGLTREELVREHKRFYRAFYFRPRPILAYALRALHPAYFVKYVRDGLNVLRFILKNG
ncbi:MAG TPA: radical SAM protein, partial [bacterium]|nr:radical SAM protein [bacterium]